MKRRLEFSYELLVLSYIKKHQKTKGTQARFTQKKMAKDLNLSQVKLADAISRLKKTKQIVVKTHKEFSYEVIGE